MTEPKSPVKTALFKSKSNKSISPIFAAHNDVNLEDMTLNDGPHINEDAEKPRVKSFPNAPSQQVVEDHNVNHLRFRSSKGNRHYID